MGRALGPALAHAPTGATSATLRHPIYHGPRGTRTFRLAEGSDRSYLGGMTPAPLQRRVDALYHRIITMAPERLELLALQLRLLRACELPAREHVPRADVVVIH